MVQFLKDLTNTVRKWQQDKVAMMGAALAFYIILSITPLLAVVVGIAGLVFEQSAIQSQIVEQIRQVSSEESAAAISFLLQNIRGFSRAELVTTIVSLLIILWGATNVFVQMQGTLNAIFGVVRKRRYVFLVSLERYILSLFLLVGLTLLILGSAAVETFFVAIDNFFRQSTAPIYFDLWRIFKFSSTFLVITFMFAVIYKLLPDAKIRWSHAFRGAGIAAVGYATGFLIIGFYFSSNIARSAYGAASSLIVVLLWVYFAAQVLLFGAEFTKVIGDRENPPTDTP